MRRPRQTSIPKTVINSTTIQAKARQVASEAQRSEYDLRQWNKDWTTEVQVVVRKVHQNYINSAKEEFEWSREDNPDATMPPVDFYDSVTEGFAQWWDDKRERLDWYDAKHRLEAYMDAHNKTEASDDMSRLDAEVEMLAQIYFNGGFGSVSEMDKTLGFISSYLYTLNNHSDGGWSGFQFATTAADIITAGIPLILMYCKTIETIR